MAVSWLRPSRERSFTTPPLSCCKKANCKISIAHILTWSRRTRWVYANLVQFYHSLIYNWFHSFIQLKQLKFRASLLSSPWVVYEDVEKHGISGILRCNTTVTPITALIFAGHHKMPSVQLCRLEQVISAVLQSSRPFPIAIVHSSSSTDWSGSSKESVGWRGCRFGRHGRGWNSQSVRTVEFSEFERPSRRIPSSNSRREIDTSTVPARSKEVCFDESRRLSCFQNGRKCSQNDSQHEESVSGMNEIIFRRNHLSIR